MIHKIIITVLLFSFVLSACGSNVETISTSTSVPALQATSTFTPQPTATPTKRLPSIYPSSFNLPKWMSNPQIMVLAVPITERKNSDIISANIAFINTKTSERFEIPFPFNDCFYFWQDNSHFGFLSIENKLIYLLDLSTGQVLEQPVSSESIRLLPTENYLTPLKIKVDPLSPQNTLFDYSLAFWGSPYSLNTTYIANSNQNNSRNEENIIVNNALTGEIIWESNPSDGYADVHFLWSPVKNSHLAIVRGKYSSSGFGFPVDDTTLALVDIETGETISSNKINAGRIQWSPDGTKILYRNALSDYWNFGIEFTDAPCYFDFESNKESCIWRIPNRPVSEGYSLITTEDYQWSADGKSIYFTYAYSTPNKMVGNICKYSLVNGSFLCPTNNITQAPYWNIDWQYGWVISTYNLSPNGEYVHFCLDSNHPLSDDRSGDSKDGLIKIDGTGFITWESQQLADGQYTISRCSFSSSIWRPLP